MDRDSVEVFLPDPDECYERLRRARFGATVSCIYCGESDPVIKKGTTRKGGSWSFATTSNGCTSAAHWSVPSSSHL